MVAVNATGIAVLFDIRVLTLTSMGEAGVLCHSASARERDFFILNH